MTTITDGYAQSAAEATLEGSAGPMIIHLHRAPASPVGLAIVAHGRNGAADQPHIVPVVRSCLDHRLDTFVPDLCYSGANASAGESAGFTMAAHLADLRTVVSWAASTVPPSPGVARILIGHSMGAYAAVKVAAEAAPGTITGVLAISPVVSGRALLRAREAMGEPAVAALKKELPSAFDEWPQHDLADVAPYLTVPAAVIVGADDTLTTPADAARLAGWLPNCVWHDVVAGEHHCPTGAGYAASVSAALDRLLVRT